jgi:hypothetical protein
VNPPEVSSLSGRASPYPADYRPAFAFSGILYPLARPPSSRSGYRPCGAGAVGLTQLIEIEMRRGEAGLYSPVGHPGAAVGKGRSDGPSHVAFWLRPVSLFGRFGVTSPASLHVRSAFHVSPGRAPPRGWQGCRRCPRSFTPWVTPQHVRVGAPKHHRVRPGCPTGTQISTLATFPARVCSKVGRAPLPPPIPAERTCSPPGD